MKNPQFIKNSGTRSFFNNLVEHLTNCSEFKISVAFITFGGLQVLLDTLKILAEKNIPGEILTTTYKEMTPPSVIEMLAKFPNIKLKIFVPPTSEDGFHAKGYLFKNNFEDKDYWSIIIGSSNITGQALKSNVEWNVLHQDNKEVGSSEFSKAVLDEFENLWNSPYSKDYSEAFLNSYIDYLKSIKESIRARHVESLFTYEDAVIKPNEMQSEAIVKLAQLRQTGAKKALAIAATGSGKTYMSVFDSLQFKPDRLLFIVHREDILRKAQMSFDNICKPVVKDYSSGLFTGSEKKIDAKYIFATRDSLSRHYTEFASDAFDYIVLDEAHHAASPQYKDILEYFKPKFLLGLTATPERTDGEDIYSIFDNNIAVEIRLRQALEYNLVCPFHYFGLKDADGIDYTKIKAEPGTKEYVQEIAKMLMISRRVDYILEKIDFYRHCGEKTKCLGFCATVEHARYMAAEFNKRRAINGNNIAIALSGEDSPFIRESIAKRLEDDDDPLQYIFTVDIFNEGIDIPSVNIVLMLRPTESSIIFIQQLGRGLRKLPDKEFVTVLDFIGNYKNSFLMAIALNGSSNFDRDTLKVQVETEFPDLPNGTYIHLDRFTKEQILCQLEAEKFMSMKYMKEAYQAFKHICGGSVPLLIDYLKRDGSTDPVRFTQFSSSFKTYMEFVARMEVDTHPEIAFALENNAFSAFMRLLSFYSPANRIEEWIVVNSILESDNYICSVEDICEKAKKYIDNVHEDRIVFACEVLSGNYFDHSEKDKYANCLLNYDGKNISFPEGLKASCRDKVSCIWLQDLVQYTLLRYQQEFGKFDKNLPFLKLYRLYTMRDIALLCGYKKIHSAFRGQGLLTLAPPNYFIFVNLHKNANVKESINYKDKFLSQSIFQWESPNSTSQDSDLGQNLIDNAKRGIHLHLFVRKFEEVEGVTQPFMYLGEVITYKDSVKNNKPIMMEFGLLESVPETIYQDFTTVVDVKKESKDEND